jgi:ABC-2 type transport system permease protein
MAGSLTVCRKELADVLGSKRYIVLFALIFLMSTMSAYQGAQFISNNSRASFLAIFYGSQFGFSFTTLMYLFGPILGLALGFDAINKERASGSLSVTLCQPIYRDSIINGKILAATASLSLLVVSTIGIMCGVAVSILGFGPSLAEVSKIGVFMLLTVVYLAFWLCLGVLFSTVTKKISTSILMSVAVWLFCAMVISIVAGLLGNYLVPIAMPSFSRGNSTNPFNSPELRALMQKRNTIETSIRRISPSFLYNEAGSAILGLTGGGGFGGGGFIEIGGGANPFRAAGGGDLGQALALVWPQITVLIVGMVICFAASYMLFLRQEIRPGG